MDTLLYSNKWISLYETDTGYVYSHETRCNGEIIAVLPYMVKSGVFMYLQRIETTPCHSNELKDTSITGGVDNGNILGTVINELKEEAGIDAHEDELISLGWIYPSKSQDTKVYLYAIDIYGKIINEAKGDGSFHERDSYCELMYGTSDIINGTDPFNPLILQRLINKGI
jgi:hypothetical protein